MADWEADPMSHKERYRPNKKPKSRTRSGGGAFLRKKLVSGNRADYNPSTDPFGVGELHQCYSLDKQKRWNLVDRLRRVENLQTADVHVSMLEKFGPPYHLPCDVPTYMEGGWPRSKTQLAGAFHDVDENGQAVHRFAKCVAAKEWTLIDKAKPKGSRRGRVVAAEDEDMFVMVDQENADAGKQLHVRYELITPFPVDFGKHSHSTKNPPFKPRQRFNSVEASGEYADFCRVADDVRAEMAADLSPAKQRAVDAPRSAYSLYDYVVRKPVKRRVSKKPAAVCRQASADELSMDDWEIVETEVPRRKAELWTKLDAANIDWRDDDDFPELF